MVIANEIANDPTACHRLPSKVEVIFFIPKMVNLEPYPGFVNELYFAPTEMLAEFCNIACLSATSRWSSYFATDCFPYFKHSMPSVDKV